ncbi:HNH endonuclease [Kosakonia sp. WA-90]|uniref:HNH endonuclease n=1 Tax=Kosakonia sp. WA-90 TaxID=3153576 RepID=UPI00325D6598
MKALSHMRIPNDDSWLALALDSDKDKVPQLLAISARLRVRYPQYDRIIQRYTVRPANSIFKNGDDFGPEKELLNHFYNFAPANLGAELTRRRNNNDLSECPYCGYPEKPNTLDHFIPESDWPEFSIYPDNLVPQCIYCARIKSKRYYSDDERRCFFIHPFYSALLEGTRFVIQLSLRRIEPDTVTVIGDPTFTVPPDTSEENRRRIKLHIDSLRIAERIREYCQQEHNNLKNFIEKGNQTHNPVNVDGYCRAKRYSALVAVGMTDRIAEPDYPHWASAYYVALIRNTAVMDYYKSLVVAPPATSIAPVARAAANVPL